MLSGLNAGRESDRDHGFEVPFTPAPAEPVGPLAPAMRDGASPDSAADPLDATASPGLARTGANTLFGRALGPMFERPRSYDARSPLRPSFARQAPSVLGRLGEANRQVDPLAVISLEAMTRHAAEFPRTPAFQSRQRWYEQLADAPAEPRVLVVGCSDCACDPAVPLGAEPGSLFMLRNAGNIVPPACEDSGETAAAIELAMRELPIEHLVVCGHSGCLSMNSYLRRAEQSGGDSKSRPSGDAWFDHLQKTADAIVRREFDDDSERQAWAAQHNVLVQTHHLSTHPAVASRLGIGDLQLHAWYFDTAAGELFAARNLKFTDDVCGLFEAV